MIRIYNTLTRKKEELAEKRVGIYVCGPTVYDESHIGHVRSAYVFDVIIKYLKFRGLKVTFVRNVTDIDDKIIDRARLERHQGELKDKVKEISEKYLARYHQDMNLFGLAAPDVEPKATEVIPDIVRFIEGLIKKGYAYETSGNVYFDIRKFKAYGKLSHRSLDNMEEGSRITVDKNKKAPLDFALWKASKSEEPSWKSSWGDGRPGWHIECSVMSTKFLKRNFLIHGGGLDLIFPHHENEIAQTVCGGAKAPKYWIHNGLLTINGEKMSKSLGNFVSIGDFQAKYKDLDLLKLLFLHSHYRHPVDYSEERIEEMKRAKERIVIFYDKLDKTKDPRPKTKDQRPQTAKCKMQTEEIEKKFLEAMDDDFNTPLAMASIFELVALGNISVSLKDIKTAKEIRDKIDKLCIIFGLSFEKAELELEAHIEELIRERDKARKNKDFNKADRLRKELFGQGLILEDTKEGTVWRRKI